MGKKPARVRGADAAASADTAPLVLQFKEAVASVLEPFAGASTHPHHGQRVVVGQRLMQPVSDIFLGWTTGLEGRHFYGRRLRDAKIKPLVESFDTDTLLIHAELCGWSLARAHAKEFGGGGDRRRPRCERSVRRGHRSLWPGLCRPGGTRP